MAPEVSDLASAGVHALGFLVALWFGTRQIAHAASGEPRRIALSFVAGWLVLFAVSAAYHALPKEGWLSAVLLAGDHGSIFVLLAAGYTPLVLVLDGGGKRLLIAIAWGGAALGLAIEAAAFAVGAADLFERQSYILYLLHGVLPPLLLGRSFFPRLPRSVVACLLGSLAVYSIGVVFYRADETWAAGWGHPVWHAMVLLGGALNFVGLRLLLDATGSKRKRGATAPWREARQATATHDTAPAALQARPCSSRDALDP